MCIRDRLCSHQGLQLNCAWRPEQVVETAEDKHPHEVADRVANKTLNPRPPVIDYVLRELLAKVVGKKTAHHWKEKNQKKTHQTYEVEHLVSEVQTEHQLALRKHQEEEILKVAVKQQRRKVDEGTEGSEKDRNSIVEEKLKDISQHDESDDDEYQVESKEVPAGREKGLSFALSFIEFTVCIVDFGIDIVFDLRWIGAHSSIYFLGSFLWNEFPLSIFDLLNHIEELIHSGSIVPLMVLVEPHFIDIDHEEEERKQFSTPRRFVNHLNGCIISQTTKNFL